MKLLIILFILFIIFGCARTPLTPEEQHERTDALIVERELFWIAYDNCLRRGTVIFDIRQARIHRISAEPDQRHKISVWDMRSAKCSPR